MQTQQQKPATILQLNLLLLVFLWTAMPAMCQKESARAEYYRGMALIKQSKYSESVKAFTKAVALDSRFISAYQCRSEAYVRMHQSERAIADLTKVISIDKNYWPAYLRRGSLYANKEQFGLALKDFNELNRIDPHNTAGYVGRAMIFSEHRSDYNQALSELSKAPKLNPKDPLALTCRAIVFRCQGQDARAIQDCSAAIELDWTAFPAYGIRVDCYEKLGKRELADRDRQTMREAEKRACYPFPIFEEAENRR